TKTIHWDELRKRGFQFSGFVVARTTVKKTFNGFFGKIVTKQVTKFVPLGGQLVAASLGYFMMKKIAQTHLNDSYNLAKRIQQKSRGTVVN
ncbi:hypothetical protein RZ645_002021, partial [Acinetobacter baumannii]|nr:hypothetical protein [Acinetobacter baumannii]